MIEAGILNTCISPELENSIVNWGTDFFNLASTLKVDLADIEKQARLHFSILTLNEKKDKHLPQRMKVIIKNRFSNYALFYKYYLKNSGAKKLIDKETFLIGDNRCRIRNKSPLSKKT